MRLNRLYRGAAIADGRSDKLRLNQSLLVLDGRIAWIRPSDGEDELPRETEVVDAGGATAVPGLVDCHSHLTGPGGVNWIARFSDPPEVLERTAEHNGELLDRAGIRWARDVGAPLGPDGKALSLKIRDHWHGRHDRPYVRAAGTWVTREGTIPKITAEAKDGDELLRLALQQLDDGADFIKLYLDGPDPETAPWTADEVRKVVDAAHARNAKVTAHSGRLNGTQVCAEAGVDSIEHGFVIDAESAAQMAARGIVLVSTLTVLKSWETFGRTTEVERFTSAEGRKRIAERKEVAYESIKRARAAGVVIAAGTDFGGGSARANQLAWEVEALVEAGLEPFEALGAATWRGGELLSEPEAGAIKEGGPADFFLVHGDPLSDPSALWRVWRTAWSGA